ncbi:MAG: hypothetical protein H6631_12835 [Anaerolineaceae bacterium]|nr:hypothetical protein [Anaerolineaceae bacterium]
MASSLTEQQQKEVHEAEQLLHEARYDPQFAETMRRRGYNEESWAHGENLVNTLKSAGRAFEQAQSTKLGAANTLKRQRESLWTQSSLLSQSCVTLFQGQTDYLNALGLHGARRDGNGISRISKPDKYSKMEQVVAWQRNLFEVAQTHAQIAPILATNGFPADILAEGAAAVETLARADHAQEQAKTAAVQRRTERDAAHKTLRIWLRCAQRIAKAAKKDSTGGGLLGR